MQLHYGINDLKDFDLMPFLPIVLPVILVGFILAMVALIDLYRNKNRRNNVLIWTLIIIFGNTLGPVLYFVIGRKDSEQVDIGN
ncbi:PLD nuclease N-terminal domain-containing protein [Psychrobacillus sp. FSL H8-0510]|uniref:PLD nuclease N-terminal domain-containing protein n=1 Tax=Psychrobacillus sp. FSL H8-0510 TaxID=2921394 RepID=UPI0030F79B54